MKKISIFCVNYNSYDELSSYFFSLEKAQIPVEKQVHVDVFVADNTETNIKNINDKYNINIKVFNYHRNYGYFGAINKMMKTVDIKEYDYVIISNVDLTVDSSIFKRLLILQHNDNVGWIAPQIYSMEESRDRNPKILERYSLRKLRILKLLYKYPLLNFLYTITAYRRKKYKEYDAGHIIYGGHGSFIILTKKYFEKCGIIDYPVFLFGEELYLAEECRNNKLVVTYEPSIKVIDSEHTSTRRMKSTFYNKCNLEAINYIIRTSYKMS